MACIGLQAMVQVDSGDSPPELYSHKTPSGMLHSALGHKKHEKGMDLFEQV